MHQYETTRRVFLDGGYAWVDVDARGSGASYGTRPCAFSSDEIRDGGQVVSWITAQPWSNGRVGATGISYDGTAAELLLANRHPAVRAIAPRFSMFDAYLDVAFPGGIFLEWFIETWRQSTEALDRAAYGQAAATWVQAWLGGAQARGADRGRRAVPALAGALGHAWSRSLVDRFFSLACRGPRPVDDDRARTLLTDALSGHLDNCDIGRGIREVTFRDDAGIWPALPDTGVDALSPFARAEEIESLQAAIYSADGSMAPTSAPRLVAT